MNTHTNIKEESEDDVMAALNAERDRRTGHRSRHDNPGDSNNPNHQGPIDTNKWNASGNGRPEIPKIGDVIRTKKGDLEGKVIEITNDQKVIFKTQDGRTLKGPPSAVTVITKLADCDTDMMETDLNEISNEMLAKYKKAAGKDSSNADARGDFKRGDKRYRGIVRATKKEFANDAKKSTEAKKEKATEGSMGGINRSAPANDVSYEKVLDEVKDRWQEEKKTKENPQLNEISQGEKKRREKEAKHAASEKARLAREAEAAATKANDERIAKKHANREKRIGKKFADIIQKQHQEKQAAQPSAVKAEPVTIPFHGWDIKYRPATNPGDPVSWIINRGEKLVHKGESASDKEAVSDAEDWIRKGAGQSGKFSKNVTIDFNKKFVNEFAPDANPFYARIVNRNNEPHLIFSHEPHEGLQKSSIRAGVDFPSISERPLGAEATRLQPHGRYIIDIDNGEELEDATGAYVFPLVFQGIVHDKSERQHMPGPGFTVAHPRDDVEEGMDPWHGYETPFDMKQGTLAKAPKSSMKGSSASTFSQMVQDTIDTHGVKWAFNYYVRKHGLPPRQFQIFAGLTAKPPGKPLQPPVAQMQKPPEKQGWWKRLLNKLE